MMDLFTIRDYIGEDEFGSLHNLEVSLDEGAMNGTDTQYGSGLDVDDSLSLTNDFIDELLCIDNMDLGNILTFDGITIHDDMQSKGSSEGVEYEVTDEEVNMLLAESIEFASDCDSKPNTSNRGHDPSNTRFSQNKKRYGSKKMMKVDWTPELHRCFVRAVEKLGVDKAIPSKILEIMGVKNLTRHNIASHLQKYRLHKKHMREAKEANYGSRGQAESLAQPMLAQQAHLVLRQTQPIVPAALQYVWGHPFHEHFWPKSWQDSDSIGSAWPLVLAQYPVGGLECMDAWGHPIARPIFYPRPSLKLPLSPMPGLANRTLPTIKARGEKLAPGLMYSPKERVDAAIKEVLKNPFTPLPLGLKPPSMESVLFEVQKLGIRTHTISRPRPIH